MVARHLQVRDATGGCNRNGCSTPSSSRQIRRLETNQGLLGTFKFETQGLRPVSAAAPSRPSELKLALERDRRPVARRGRSAPSSLRQHVAVTAAARRPSSSRHTTRVFTARLLDTFKFETEQTASPQVCRLLSAFESETTCPCSAPRSLRQPRRTGCSTPSSSRLSVVGAKGNSTPSRSRHGTSPLTSRAELNYYLVPHSSTIYVISRS